MSGAFRPPRPRNRRAPPRHSLPVRVTHWLNALAMVFLAGSGLNIFNAHPRLYWGQIGADYDRAWLAIAATGTDDHPRGVLGVGSWVFDTTGFLGVSWRHGRVQLRAWPDWLTLPGFQDLADARHWHFLFAWILVTNGLAYGLWSLVSGHLRRDLVPSRADLRALPASLIQHLKLRHDPVETALRYNGLQKLAYLAALGLGLTMVLTGLTMSPGMDAAAPVLLDLFGGRQSARSIHFLCAGGLFAFVVIHLSQVVLVGPVTAVGSMITGRWPVPAPGKHPWP